MSSRAAWRPSAEAVGGPDVTGAWQLARGRPGQALAALQASALVQSVRMAAGARRKMMGRTARWLIAALLFAAAVPAWCAQRALAGGRVGTRQPAPGPLAAGPAQRRDAHARRAAKAGLRRHRHHRARRRRERRGAARVAGHPRRARSPARAIAQRRLRAALLLRPRHAPARCEEGLPGARRPGRELPRARRARPGRRRHGAARRRARCRLRCVDRRLPRAQRVRVVGVRHLLGRIDDAGRRSRPARPRTGGRRSAIPRRAGGRAGARIKRIRRAVGRTRRLRRR